MNTLTKKVFLTGGTGFLGSYILQQLLKNQYSVRALRRNNKTPFYFPNDLIDRVEWIEGDVLDVMSLQDGMEGMDAVIHSAAIVSFNKKDRKVMYKVNVEGTANVVNMALENNIKRFIHVSSVAALGRTPSGGNVNEEKKWEENDINTHYAKSKHKAELEVWRSFCEGLNGVILNPSTILGYGDWNTGSCSLFKNVYNEFKWYSDGFNGFVDVEDVATVVLRFLENDITEQRFIVNSENWAFKQLQDVIADEFGKNHPSRKATPLLLDIAWRVENLKSAFSGSRPLLTRESAKVAQSSTYFENDKIREALKGFSFRPLEETIKKACEKYLGTVTALQP